MLTFSKDLELTFIEQKVSKNGNVYVVVRFMSENGSTMDCIYKGNKPLNTFELRKTYNFQFEYSLRGKYTSFVCLEING